MHQLVETGTLHDVLAPSYTEYFYYHDGKYLGTATFQGWQVEDTSILLQPGDKHDLRDHKGSLTLKAQWETKEGGVQQNPLQSSIVNFYVFLRAAPAGPAVLIPPNLQTPYFPATAGSSVSLRLKNIYARKSMANSILFWVTPAELT